MNMRKQARRVQSDARALHTDTMDLLNEAISHPMVERTMHAIRRRPVTAVLVTAALVYLGSRAGRGHHLEG